MQVMATEKQLEQIFHEELLPHVDALYGFAYHLTGNDEDSADLVQETCYKAFRAMESYQPGTNGKAWMFRILKHTFINEYRRKKKGPIATDFNDFTNIHDEQDATNYSSYSDLRTEMFDKMMGDEVTDAINSLPVNFRTVILLCDVEGFTYEEIAAILDIPIGTVRSGLHRGRNLLREKLKTYARDKGYLTDDE